MSYYDQHTTPPVGLGVGVVDVSIAPLAMMEQTLFSAIQSGDLVERDRIIKAWVARLGPHSWPFQLGAAHTIVFADNYGLPHLLGPACLAFVLEAPLSSYTWPTGAVVSTFNNKNDPEVSLTDAQYDRLLLGYYAMQSTWVRLRTAPHNPNKCSPQCLASWLFQWSLTDQRFSGQGDICTRVKKMREELFWDIGMAVAAAGTMGQFMTSDCWNAALVELDATLEGIEAGAPFFGI